MLIIRPKRWLEKPPVTSYINQGHPLATGLIFCMALNEYGPNWNNRAALPVVLDATRNFGINFTNSGSNLVYNTPGPGYNVDNVLKFWTVPHLCGTLACSIPTDQMTVLVIRRKTDTTARASALFGNSTSATLSYRCNAYVPWSDGNMYWDFGGATAPNRLTVSGLSWTTGVEYLAFTAGGRGSAFWRNGQKLGSQSTAITRVRAASEAFGINVVSGAGGDVQDFFFVAVSNVQWDDSLVQWWMQEPYGMFVPQSPRLTYFIPPDSTIKQPRVFVVT